MRKKITSYRLGNQSLKKIESLTVMINQQNENMEIPNISNTDVVTEAIDYFYSVKMDANAGDAYLMKIDILVKDVMKQYMNEIISSLNSINYSTQKNQEYLSILLKTSPIPKDDMETIVNAKSKYESFVDEKLMRKVKDE